MSAMSTKDGLLGGGVVVALALSILALVSRPDEAPEPPPPGPPPAPAVPAGLERRLAAAESRAAELQGAVAGLRKRIADLESRGPSTAARPPGPAPAAVTINVPEAVRDIGLDGILGHRITHGIRNIQLGGGSAAEELAKGLDLTKDQAARVREILDEFRKAVDERIPAGGGAVAVAGGGAVTVAGGGGDMTGALRELQTDLKGRLANVLDDEQRKKLDALVATHGLPIEGTNTVWRFRETPGGGVAVSSSSIRNADNQVRIEIRTDDAGVAPPPPGHDGGGDPDGVF